ncbi:MAG: hypothetical protein ACK5HL_02190 [Bacilli bacterium]
MKKLKNILFILLTFSMFGACELYAWQVHDNSPDSPNDVGVYMNYKVDETILINDKNLTDATNLKVGDIITYKAKISNTGDAIIDVFNVKGTMTISDSNSTNKITKDFNIAKGDSLKPTESGNIPALAIGETTEVTWTYTITKEIYATSSINFNVNVGFNYVAPFNEVEYNVLYSKDGINYFNHDELTKQKFSSNDYIYFRFTLKNTSSTETLNNASGFGYLRVESSSGSEYFYIGQAPFDPILPGKSQTIDFNNFYLPPKKNTNYLDHTNATVSFASHLGLYGLCPEEFLVIKRVEQIYATTFNNLTAEKGYDISLIVTDNDESGNEVSLDEKDEIFTYTSSYKFTDCTNSFEEVILYNHYQAYLTIFEDEISVNWSDGEVVDKSLYKIEIKNQKELIVTMLKSNGNYDYLKNKSISVNTPVMIEEYISDELYEKLKTKHITHVADLYIKTAGNNPVCGVDSKNSNLNDNKYQSISSYVVYVLPPGALPRTGLSDISNIWMGILFMIFAGGIFILSKYRKA